MLCPKIVYCVHINLGDGSTMAAARVNIICKNFVCFRNRGWGPGKREGGQRFAMSLWPNEKLLDSALHRRLFLKIGQQLSNTFAQVLLLWAGNQSNHQNFDPSLLPKKLWLIDMEKKQKIHQNFFSTSPWKSVKVSWVARMGQNFDAYSGF